jgi:hypothetical protein
MSTPPVEVASLEVYHLSFRIISMLRWCYRYLYSLPVALPRNNPHFVHSCGARPGPCGLVVLRWNFCPQPLPFHDGFFWRSSLSAGEVILMALPCAFLGCSVPPSSLWPILTGPTYLACSALCLPVRCVDLVPLLRLQMPQNHSPHHCSRLRGAAY